MCGGGARLPSAAAKAAGWGLTGLEFGINIPGTVGGAVRMNANAYGGELARVLEWVDVCTAGGVERRAPDELGFAYRRSNLRPGEVVVARLVRAAAATPARSRRRSREHAGPAPRGAALGHQDLRLDIQESRRPARRRPHRRASCSRPPAAAGLQVGGARFSPKHANFVENAGGATTADILALMAEGRRRVRERFGVVAGARGAGPGRRRVARRLGSRAQRLSPQAGAVLGGGEYVATDPAATAAGRRRAGAGSSRSPARPKSSRKPPTKRSPRSRPTARSPRPPPASR